MQLFALGSNVLLGWVGGRGRHTCANMAHAASMHEIRACVAEGWRCLRGVSAAHVTDPLLQHLLSLKHHRSESFHI